MQIRSATIKRQAGTGVVSIIIKDMIFNCLLVGEDQWVLR